MPRSDLTESQLEALSCWAEGSAKRGLIDHDKGQAVIAVVAELRRLRENESNTRFLMNIEGEV